MKITFGHLTKWIVFFRFISFYSRMFNHHRRSLIRSRCRWCCYCLFRCRCRHRLHFILMNEKHLKRETHYICYKFANMCHAMRTVYKHLRSFYGLSYKYFYIQHLAIWLSWVKSSQINIGFEFKRICKKNTFLSP